jgi:hemerythrin-like domain-containing protein
MEDIKPIKRSKELTPLSREHHDGLLFVWKIRAGLSKEAPVNTMERYVRWFWLNHIKPHFKDEEKVLLKYLPADNLLVQQMVEEHVQIRDMILSLNLDCDKGTLKMLADFIEKHIRFEERELFAFAEKALTPEQLQHVSKLLDKEHVCATEWNEEFWK